MWTAPRNLQACSVLHAFACHTPVSRFYGDSKSINFCAQTCTLWPYCLLRVRKDAQYHVGEDGTMYVSHSLSLSLSFSLFYSLNVVSEAPPHIECQKKKCVCRTGLSAAGSLMYALLDRALHHGSWKAFATRSCNASRFLIAVRSFLCNDSVRFSACFCTFFKSSLNTFILPFKALNLRR